MKCPQCQNNQRAKLGLTCGKCGYRFIFNPKSSDTPKMTDGKFLSSIRTASHNGTQYFTGNQLYAAYCRSQTASRWPAILFGLVFMMVGGILILNSSNFVGYGLLVVGGIALIGGIFSKKEIVSPEKFEQYIQKFKQLGRPIEKLIDEPALHEPPPDWPEPDIYDYGVERLLIVERDLLVDLFVKNDLHTEHRMLVIAESGYPEYLLPVAKRLLEERPDLPVFLLHDATPNGTDMKDRLLASGMLPLSDHPITDMGLFPEDFEKLQRTKDYDPANKDRTLPVDAMMLPFLVGGLGTAFADGIGLSELLERQAAETGAGGEFDFG